MPNDTKRTWHLVEFEVDSQQEDMAAWLMMQLGANGCQVEPFLGPADGAAPSPPVAADIAGARVRLQATFELDALPDGDLARVSAALDEYGLNASIASLRTKQLLEEDWLTKWKVGFEPFPVGDRLLVCPPWHRKGLTAQQITGRKVVLIEPGLAFGTGFHETTRFCLLALQDYADHAVNVLDIGSGSGILSIAVALLSDRAKIVGLETDPVACKNAGENFALNQVGKRIELFEASTSKLVGTADGAHDLILANLTYEDHIALLADYVKLAAPGAHILFAGILKEKGDLMSAALAKHGLQQVRRDDGEKWTGFVARKV